MGQEMSRAHARGYNDGLGGGTYIGRFFIIAVAATKLKLF
jgi:hypothetical protein